MTTIPYREGADFPKLPTATAILVKVVKANFVNEKNPFFGKAGNDGKIDDRANRDMVKVIMEATEEEYAGARVWANFGASIHESSKLRPFINACSERDLTTEELKSFNVENLEGSLVQVFGSYADGDTEQKYLRPSGYLRAAKPKAATGSKTQAASAPAPTAEVIDF